MMQENSRDSVWKIPLRSPTLKDNEIHVWRANLELSPPKIERLTALLSSDEIARADRFRFPQHRRRFIVARGILRQLLGDYLSVAPHSLNFAYEARGKPFLTGEDTNIKFNISHSQEYALFGFTRKYLIGVDLEYQRSMDCLKIAERFFLPQEFEIIRQAASERTKLFFQLWTAKEAYLKALGTGLSGSLTSIEIALDLHQHPYIQSLEEDKLDWSLYSCTPAKSYLGAIAVKTSSSEPQIFFWHWQ